MSLLVDLDQDVQKVICTERSFRLVKEVPTPSEVTLAGGVVELDAVVLYADLDQSSLLIDVFDRRVSAKVVRAFLECCVRIIRANGGAIASIDGNRVMGIFVGDDKCSNAAKCALQINYAVQEIIDPKLTEYFKSLDTPGFYITHNVGVDCGRVIAARAGVRNAGDLVWIGKPLKLAAILSGKRESPYHTYISESIYNLLGDEVRYGGNPKQNMWKKRMQFFDRGSIYVYRSNWYWEA